MMLPRLKFRICFVTLDCIIPYCQGFLTVLLAQGIISRTSGSNCFFSSPLAKKKLSCCFSLCFCFFIFSCHPLLSKNTTVLYKGKREEGWDIRGTRGREEFLAHCLHHHSPSPFPPPMTVSYELRQSLHPMSFRSSSWSPAAGAWTWGAWSCDCPPTWDQKVKFRNKNCFW